MISFTQKFTSAIIGLLIAVNTSAFEVDLVYNPNPINTEHQEISIEELYSSCSNIRVPCIIYKVTKE